MKGCVIMASGTGTRFGGNKLMAELCGKPLLCYVIEAVSGLFDRYAVVTRSREVKELCDRLSVFCILHDLPGRNDTVRLGLSAMEGMERVMFCQGDQPLLRRESIEKLLRTGEDFPHHILRLSFGGTVGSPVLFPKDFFPELLDLPEGKGGGVVMKAHPEQVMPVEASDPMELQDVDTREELQRLHRLFSSISQN